jgi:CrcB protein
VHKVLMIGLGGFIGAISRYYVSGLAQGLSKSVGFPYGTLVVNLFGCFLIGVISHLIEASSSMAAEMRLFLIVGLIGSFTTYAAFSMETLRLLQSHRFALALINILAHLILGLAAVLAGRSTLVALWR